MRSIITSSWLDYRCGSVWAVGTEEQGSARVALREECRGAVDCGFAGAEKAEVWNVDPTVQNRFTVAIFI